jgi:thymidylate kinase
MKSIVSAEAAVLESLFGELNSSGIAYAVMRNYQGLPGGVNGSDLDLLVSDSCGERASILMRRAIESADGVAIGTSRSPGFVKICSFGRANAECGWWGLCIDVNNGLFYQGQRVMARDVPWPSLQHNGIRCLSDGFGAVLGVVKEVLHNGSLPDRYLAAARKAALEDWPEMENLLQPMGQSALRKLRALLLGEVAGETHRELSSAIRRSFRLHAFFLSPARFVWGRLQYEFGKLRRYLRPQGLVVAVLGTDGAGKSTVIESILPTLQAATHNSVIVHHLRPGLLMPLSRFKGVRVDPTVPVLNPHAAAPSGLLGSLFRLSYLTIDYVAGYWLKVRPKIGKQPCVVLYDRYAYDMVIDPRRFRIGCSSKVASWFTRLVPKPDLIYCLYGSPEVLHARKRELTIQETARQVGALRAFAAEESRAILVEVDTAISTTRDEILTDIKRHLVGAVQ